MPGQVDALALLLFLLMHLYPSVTVHWASLSQIEWSLDPADIFRQLRRVAMLSHCSMQEQYMGCHVRLCNGATDTLGQAYMQRSEP